MIAKKGEYKMFKNLRLTKVILLYFTPLFMRKKKTKICYRWGVPWGSSKI